MSSNADGPSAGTAPAVPAPAGRRRVLMTVATMLATAALAGYCLLLVVPSLLGFQRYVLTGGSMEPTLHRGSLVFDRVTPVEELVVGDVITYVPPGMSSPLSHRIMSITRGDDGGLVFTTRGDANGAVDPWLFTLDDPGQARVSFDVPYAGYPLWVLGSPLSRFLLIGAPALVVAGVTGRRMWRQAGELVAAEERGSAGEPAEDVPVPAEDERVPVSP
jgi:signal peptidase